VEEVKKPEYIKFNQINYLNERDQKCKKCNKKTLSMVWGDEKAGNYEQTMEFKDFDIVI
jgi:hypothetical protein